MRRFSLKEYLLYYLVRAVGFLFRLFPLPLALFIARRAGALSMHFNPKRKSIAYANLKAALGARYAPIKLKRILKGTYENMSQGIMELLFLPKIGKRYVERYFRFENFHFAEEALQKGRGLIFLTAHFGTWEMANIALPAKGFAYTAIARDQKPYLLNELLNRYRQSKGCRIVPKGPAVKEILRALKSNGVVGMLVDQDAGRDGIFAELFGRKASWHRGVMELALKTGATIVPGFAIREKGPYIRFKLFRPIELLSAKDKEEAIREGFRQYVAVLESLIRGHPSQWLWQHRRWKSTPDREVIILDDGRTGHLRQSQAVVKKIRGIWQKRGYNRQDIRAKIIKVRFKNNYSKWFLKLGSNFSSSSCQGCMGCLRLCLDKNTYQELMGSYADIIVSCGSNTAAANLILSKENNAKSIVIMKPPLINLRKFNLAIIPRHDNPPKAKNIVITDGALNLISRQKIYEMAQGLGRMAGPLKDRRIGILLGGSTRGFDMQPEAVSRLLAGAIEACDKYDCSLLLTTSRRTPKDAETVIRERLGGHKRAGLLIIANEKNIDGAVEGILSLSGVVLVSEESISMISESASSGAYTIVFRQGGSLDKRHEAFLKNLDSAGYIKIADIKDLYNILSGFFREHPKQNILDDAAKVEEALERIL